MKNILSSNLDKHDFIRTWLVKFKCRLFGPLGFYAGTQQYQVSRPLAFVPSNQSQWILYNMGSHVQILSTLPEKGQPLGLGVSPLVAQSTFGRWTWELRAFPRSSASEVWSWGGGTGWAYSLGAGLAHPERKGKAGWSGPEESPKVWGSWRVVLVTGIIVHWYLYVSPIISTG